MGYLLKEALKTLCGVNQWSYAIFWKIGCQNPKLLIWEECYYEPVIYFNGEHGVQATNKVHLLVTKMMKDNYINLLGEGLVGRVAFTRNHQWIISGNKKMVHPPEVANEVYTQFSAGIQTIAVIPIHPHGVVQLGSSSTIIENMGFVRDVKSLISQLGWVPGALLSENYVENEDDMDCTLFTSDSCNKQGPNHSPQASGNSGHTSLSFNQQTGTFSENYDLLRSMEQYILSDAIGDQINDVTMSQITSSSPFSMRDSHFSNAHTDTHPMSEKSEHELFQALTMSSEETSIKPPSRDDLFDIVGMGQNNHVNSGVELNPLGFKKGGVVLEHFSVFEGESDSGIYSSTAASDHLLDAVVSKVHTSSKQIADENAPYLSSAPVNYSSSVMANRGTNLMQKELISVPNYLSNTTGVTSSYSSDSSSIVSSQISSWADERRDGIKDGVFTCGNTKRSNDVSKSNRKRLKPGENPRPRPKDRQMIQDRVKELREIIPHSAKCSIDALLERTIKHMLFLQSITKHSDKLTQVRESKFVSKDGGLLLRDNFEGGATWAYEVGSQSMVCPIIVEDLDSPRQMLVEMLCDETGSFLEIADIIKGLSLTILKGVMEFRNDKIWAHFTVEANRDVTRMEIFISLVSLFEQSSKNGATKGHKYIVSP
ncbi:transcription factor LHW isoform X2 [Rutidosis leptorrhynchoides]|uniref:transcription factor LHW isoform X2 n=1 Tax=Rutidosis leptorrhynchoides TaxID=125765 RepID=UPI003A9A454E